MPAMSDIDPILRTDFKAVDKRDAIHNVWGWLTGDSAKVPIIMDGQKPFGVVNGRSLMSRRIDPSAHLEQYALPTKALPETATLQEISQRMAHLRASHMPIEDKKGKLRGYVTSVDVARAQANAGSAADLAVPVTALKMGHTVGDALHAFQSEYVDWLPIMNGSGRVENVIGRRSILNIEANGANGRGRKDNNGEKLNALEAPLDGFAEDVVFRLPSGASQEDVFQSVEKNGYVVIEGAGGRFVGMVTAATLLRVP